MAGSQFFDITWSLLDALYCFGYEISWLGTSCRYLATVLEHAHRFRELFAHSPLLPNEQRAQADDLYQRLHQHVKPGQTPWLSLTGYELEPHSFGIVKRD